MRAFLVALFLLALTGCVTRTVDIAYQPAVSAPAGPSAGTVAIGSFADKRSKPSRALGVVRGGFGNAVKTLETPVPVRDVVAKAFADGLAARGLLGDGSQAKYALNGTIVRFDASQLMRREAHCEIRVVLVERDTGKPVFALPARQDLVSGSALALDVGLFASAADLAALAADALQRVVDQSLDNPEFAAAARR